MIKKWFPAVSGYKPWGLAQITRFLDYKAWRSSETMRMISFVNLYILFVFCAYIVFGTYLLLLFNPLALRLRTSQSLLINAWWKHVVLQLMDFLIAPLIYLQVNLHCMVRSFSKPDFCSIGRHLSYRQYLHILSALFKYWNCADKVSERYLAITLGGDSSID